jgi:hypothetical protein
MTTEANAKRIEEMSVKERSKMMKHTAAAEVHERAQGLQNLMEALGGASESTDLTASGTVVAGRVEAFTFAGATPSRASTAGDGVFVGQRAVGELSHSVVGDHLEMSGRV